MKLEGVHHVTSITADAQTNVDFYAGRLGLRRGGVWLVGQHG